MECVCSDTSDDMGVFKKLETNDNNELKSTPTEKSVLPPYDSDGENEEHDGNDTYVDTEFTRGVAEPVFVPSDSFRNFQTPTIQRESIANRKNSVYSKLSTPLLSNFHGTLTSTPAPVCLSNDVLTPSPFCCSTEDMSPITMSAQKMPKSMQV